MLEPSGDQSRRKHVAVKARGQDPGGAARRGNDGELLTRIVDQPFRPTLHIGDVLAVRTPGWRSAAPAGIHVRPVERGHLARGGARCSSDHINVVVVGSIKVARPLAHERQGLAIGRPGGGELVVVPRSKNLGLTGGQIEQVKVAPTPIEIARLVFFELKSIDDDRLGRVMAAGIAGGGVRIWITGDECQSFAVGRPGKFGHPSGKIGDTLRLPATAVQQPDLRRIVGVLPAGQEGEITIISGSSGECPRPPCWWSGERCGARPSWSSRDLDWLYPWRCPAS